MQYLLKVFSGPHVGAEVVLADGETIIGSADTCDIVLDDRLISARHAAVSVSDETIEVRPLGKGTVLVDGQPVEQTAVRPFQYFTMGTTHMAVGPADKPWPKFDLSDFQLRAPADDDDGTEDEDESSEAHPDDPPHVDAPADAEDSRRKRLPVTVTAIIATAVSITLVAVIGVAATLASSTAERSDPPVANDALRKLAARYTPHVAMTSAGDRLSLRGYVATEQDRLELLRAARASDAHVAFKVRSTESLLLSVRKALAKDGWKGKLVASAAEPGVIRITGRLGAQLVGARQRWQLTERRIEKDIPLKRLVVDFGKVAAVANKTQGRIPIPAPDSSQRVQSFRSAPLPILDVRVAHDKVVTLVDGRQVSAGGRLPDGSLVEDINLDHAIARTASGHRLVIPFGVGG